MNHLPQIAAKLKEHSLDAMLITSAPGEYYAVGFHGEGFVLVTPQEHVYVTDPRYIEAARQVVGGAQVEVTSRSRTARELLCELVQARKIERLGFEDGYMTVLTYHDFSKALPCVMVPAQTLLAGLRSTKDTGEIEALTAAQRIAERALGEILGFIRPGMTEKEIAAKLVYDMLRFGAERTSFDPIVVAGPNGSLPHGVPGDRPVQQGDFITMDFGCKWGGYCSDMTRTVALGRPTEEMERVYATVLEAQCAGIAAVRAGTAGKEIDAAARRVIDSAGYGEYFGHGFGHSLGLEIHEAPNANSAEETLMPVGAVISAEPGIYLPGRFGVRIEDVVVVTQDGCENLTKAPKELIIL